MKRLLFSLGLGAVALASGCNRPYYNGYYGQPYAPAYPAVQQGYAPVQQMAPAGNCAPVYNGGVTPTYSVPAGTMPAAGVPMTSTLPMNYQPMGVQPVGMQPVGIQPVGMQPTMAANPAYAPTYAAPGAAPLY